MPYAPPSFHRGLTFTGPLHWLFFPSRRLTIPHTLQHSSPFQIHHTCDSEQSGEPECSISVSRCGESFVRIRLPLPFAYKLKPCKQSAQELSLSSLQSALCLHSHTGDSFCFPLDNLPFKLRKMPTTETLIGELFRSGHFLEPVSLLALFADVISK